MFDIGGLELILIAIVGLLVIGPERLPETLRMIGLWLGRLRRSFTSVKAEIEKEIGMDEVRRQLHNESVMEEMKRIEREVQNSVHDAKIDPDTVAGKPSDEAQETAADNPPAPSESSDEAQQAESDSLAPYEPPKPRPRTEAEVEAAYERKMRAQQANAKDN